MKISFEGAFGAVLILCLIGCAALLSLSVYGSGISFGIPTLGYVE